jgi:Putative metallopeptidase
MKPGLLQRRDILLLLYFVLLFSAEPIFAQPASPEAASSEGEKFQDRINETARTLGSNPRFKSLAPKYRQELAEFITGNMLFVVLHEIGHVAISQMGLPVLGRPEDAADSFAAVGLIRIGSEFSHRVLADAAKGWFLADRRDERAGDMVAFYDEHGLNQQRAYQIVCLMVGSDEDKFKDIATDTKLPKGRQESCAADFSNATYSWDLLLKPHVRTPDQPKTKIDVVYGEAKGRLELAAQALRSIQLLETVAEHTAAAFAWPAPFTLELQACGFPNARWSLPTRKLTLCYELAADFAELYTAYGAAPAETRLTTRASRKRKSK